MGLQQNCIISKLFFMVVYLRSGFILSYRRWRMLGTSITDWKRMWTGWSQPCRDRWTAMIFLRSIFLGSLLLLYSDFNQEALLRDYRFQIFIQDKKRDLVGICSNIIHQFHLIWMKERLYFSSCTVCFKDSLCVLYAHFWAVLCLSLSSRRKFSSEKSCGGLKMLLQDSAPIKLITKSQLLLLQTQVRIQIKY